MIAPIMDVRAHDRRDLGVPAAGDVKTMSSAISVGARSGRSRFPLRSTAKHAAGCRTDRDHAWLMRIGNKSQGGATGGRQRGGEGARQPGRREGRHPTHNGSTPSEKLTMTKAAPNRPRS